MELRFHRTERQCERLGEVLVLHAVQIVRRHKQTVIRRQTRNRFFESIAKLEIAELSVGRGPRRSSARALVVEREGGRPTVMILYAHVRHDAVDPRGKARLPSKVGE